MHELSITQSILNIAVSSAQKEHAKKVNKITIVLGEMTDFIPQYIQEYYNIVSKGTIAENAELVFKKAPAIARCLDCGHDTHLKDYKFICENCASQNLKIISGKEFFVETIDID
ncbi:MAG: hydrogenase maturation nickel metallochaperone HypA [Clostridia bacterium]|nr:hydrogenase maturation nickel metallochaperone HypA [Clostridia bacterium]